MRWNHSPEHGQQHPPQAHLEPHNTGQCLLQQLHEGGGLQKVSNARRVSRNQQVLSQSKIERFFTI